MSGMLARKALRRSLDQIRYVSAVRPAAAQGLVARVYGQVERDFGMLAPPVALHSPAAGPLAACWLMLRETLLAAGQADRAAKEAVAAAVSLSNACPYCVTVHTAALRALGDAERRLDGIASWARLSCLRESAVAQPVPFPAGQLPELAGVAVTFHYLNRMANVFLGPGPLPPRVPSTIGEPLMRLLGRIMRSASRHPIEPGGSLELLPDAPLPADIAWAQGSPSVAGAFARGWQAIETAGERAVPLSVRELIQAECATWAGQRPGLSRAWVEDKLRPLAAADRPAGRLALLTAFASYQVAESDIGEFRRGSPGDETLIELASWASLTAARTAGAWLAISPTRQGWRRATPEMRQMAARADD